MHCQFTNQIARLGLLLFTMMVAGCDTISSTNQFYRPFTTDTYPPKPEDYPIPVLGAKPNRKFITLGRLSFSAGHGYKYMIRSIEYNARKVGADAAIMINSSSESEQYTYTVPGYTTYKPVTTYSTAQANANFYGSGGYGYGSASGSGTSTTYMPQFNPGYTGVGTVVRHEIDAVLIRFQ